MLAAAFPRLPDPAAVVLPPDDGERVDAVRVSLIVRPYAILVPAGLAPDRHVDVARVGLVGDETPVDRNLLDPDPGVTVLDEVFGQIVQQPAPLLVEPVPPPELCPVGPLELDAVLVRPERWKVAA